MYHPDSFEMMPRYCANLKAIRYESSSLNRIVADKSHHVIMAIVRKISKGESYGFTEKNGENCLLNPVRNGGGVFFTYSVVFEAYDSKATKNNSRNFDFSEKYIPGVPKKAERLFDNRTKAVCSIIKFYFETKFTQI